MVTLSRSIVPSSCMQAALAYAQDEGVPVFPLHGKVPFAGSKGFYDATTDLTTITDWWQRWPWANIGIPTGRRSGWVVLDIDARHDGFASLARLTAAQACSGIPVCSMPLTRTARTGGGGLHLVFAFPTDLTVPLKNAVMLGGYPGVDLRADGGYVVVAPSRHASGGRYTWLWREPLAPIPPVLLALCTSHPVVPMSREPLSITPPIGMGSDGVGPRRKRWSADVYLEMALSKAQVGSRHRYALFLACRLLGEAGLSLAQAEAYMRVYAARVPAGDHPYSEREALRCLYWAHAHV